jgi:hypothetical protein
MADEVTEYKDMLGREIKVGHHIAIARGVNSMVFAKVDKLTPKQIRVHPLKSTRTYYLYPKDCLIMDGEDMLVYLLKL